ncbi:MAG TPA: alpha-isopropylmalate synthase regulatory domain-containing protein, partial [Gemmatimonadaceae bacterium]|nr:alpha-isopropylmalate synthase regulatory domain-containing protein [Gemmatimonadaceae bacterium]
LVGLDGGRLVLGKHSGRHALRKHLEAAGHALSEEEFAKVFARFKEVADRKKLVDDRDIEAIVAGETRRALAVYELELVQVSCGTHAIPTATVRLRGPEGGRLVAAAQGDGPVDAVCRAINQVLGDFAELVEFTVDPVTEGIDAVGGVTVRLRQRANGSDARDASSAARGRVVSGFGVHTDVIVATAEAYLAAMNSIVRCRSGVGAADSDGPSLTSVVDLAPRAAGASL